MPELIQIDATRPIARAVTIGAIILSLLASWFVGRWYLGNTLAEYLDPDEHELSMARTAVSLAPNDPLTHWRLGIMTEKRLTPDQMQHAVSEYEKAVALSPNDYRFWSQLGMGLEQLGDDARAEKALRTATDLAPSYAYPRWNLGNLLLRDGRYEDGFAELRRASTADPVFRPQLFNLAWEVYKDDIESLKSAVGSTSEARAQFASYLVSRQRVEDGIRLWHTLTVAEKQTNRSAGETIVGALIGSHRYYQAAEVANNLVPGPAYHATEGKIIDSGLEENLSPQKGAVFGWQVTQMPQTQVGIDAGRSHSGSRSLRLVFQVRARLDAIKVSQLVLIKPDSEYELEYYVKTEKLQSGATPYIEIFDPAAGAVIGSSEVAQDRDSDWKRVALTFKTGNKSEAVTLRVARGSCGQDPVCPIFGTLWYDDFNLKRRN